MRSHLVRLFAKEFKVGVKAAPAAFISGDVLRSGKFKLQSKVKAYIFLDTSKVNNAFLPKEGIK